MPAKLLQIKATLKKILFKGLGGSPYVVMQTRMLIFATTKLDLAKETLNHPPPLTTGQSLTKLTSATYSLVLISLESYNKIRYKIPSLSKAERQSPPARHSIDSIHNAERVL